jgi:rubredoxin
MKILQDSRPACNAGTGEGCVAPPHGPGVQSGAKAAKTAASLGSNAKYNYKPEKVDPDTGEIIGFSPMDSRVQRFALQSVARTFFPDSRLNKCLRLRQQGKDVQVLKSKEFKTASYSGLQTCGSVWRCPVCSAKIAERRRVEIIAAMVAHKAAGGVVNMLTLTCPHQFKDKLADLLAKQAKALTRFWSDRHVKAILKEMGTIGQIRALEVTHGRLSDLNNGWHPHYHILMFQGLEGVLVTFDQQQMTDWQVRLYLRWVNACKLAGLGEPSYAHGLKLDDGEHAAKYVTKWGLEDEMTKGHTKKAISGETPFDFLRAYLLDKTDKQAMALFIEFAETFQGKRQLHWSKGLKKRFAIAEKSDEALAEEKEDATVYLGKIELDQWRDVLCVDGRVNVLVIAASSGWEAVSVYLDSIKGRYEDKQRNKETNKQRN